jgi:glycosyltransferase involved in cell wall biosynthesis
MGKQEGLDYLLNVVRYIVWEKGYQDVYFVLIGSGPAIAQLKYLAEKLEVTEFVEFTDRIPDEELLERLSTCDVCVNPDLKTPFNDRSTMNKILEYMALGKPIVQNDLIEGRRSAAGASLYAKPNDEIDFAEKILKLLHDPELRRQMGVEGQRRMKEMLEWRHQIPKLLEVYAKALPEQEVLIPTVGTKLT